jgi:hypothetical protein
MRAMQSLPDLARLSHEQKDELIRLLGPPPDGQPPRTGGQRHGHHGGRLCRTRSGQGDDQRRRTSGRQPNAQDTLGADKGYDAKEFIEALQDMNIIPHVAQNTSGRCSAVPDSIAASAGYAISVQKRKLIEQGLGWAKTVGSIRQVMVRGLKRVDQIFVLTMAAYNLTRMRTLGQIRLQTA